MPLMDRRSWTTCSITSARHGVHEVVLSSPYLEETFHPFIEARHGDPRDHVDHRGPSRSAPAARSCNALDSASSDEPFFALNGDILTDLDLTAMLAFHRERGRRRHDRAHHVEDARPFGLVPTRGRRPGAGVPGEAGRSRSPAT